MSRPRPVILQELADKMQQYRAAEMFARTLPSNTSPVAEAIQEGLGAMRQELRVLLNELSE